MCFNYLPDEIFSSVLLLSASDSKAMVLLTIISMIILVSRKIPLLVDRFVTMVTLGLPTGQYKDFLNRFPLWKSVEIKSLQMEFFMLKNSP